MAKKYTVKLRRNGLVIGKAEGFDTQASAHAYAQKVADAHPSDKVTIENATPKAQKRNGSAKASTRYRISEGGRELARSERLLSSARKRAQRLARITGRHVQIVKEHLKGRTLLSSAVVETVGPRANRGGRVTRSVASGQGSRTRRIMLSERAAAEGDSSSSSSSSSSGHRPRFRPPESSDSSSSSAAEPEIDDSADEADLLENPYRRRRNYRRRRTLQQSLW